MNKSLLLLFLFSAATASAGAAKPPAPDPLARLIPLGDKDDVGYLIRIPAGVIPAQGDAKSLDLIQCFMQNQLVTFLYYVGGKPAARLRREQTLG